MLRESIVFTLLLLCGVIPSVRAEDFRLPVDFQDNNYGYDWRQDTGHEYGCREGNVFHPGKDINKIGTTRDGDKGEILRAVSDGIVVFADDSRWASLILQVFTGNGEPYYVVYGHSEINPTQAQIDSVQEERRKTDSSFIIPAFATPRVGHLIKKGDIVGLLWDNWTQDAHLHLEIRTSRHPDPTNGGSWCSVYGGQSIDRIGEITVDPINFLNSHHPATIISKGEQGFYHVGDYVFKGSSQCDTANARFKIVNGSRSDNWITDEVSQTEACPGIQDAIGKTVQNTKDNEGVIRLDGIVESKKVPWWSSWASQVTSFFHTIWMEDIRIPAAIAADSSVQQKLAVYRTGQVYEIAGTDKQVVMLTNGPGMNGDKAVDRNPYGKPDPAEAYNPPTGSNASGTRPDLVSTDLWTERSSGNPWTTIAWGDTVCLVASVKNAGNADTPTDVKVSFYVSKGNHEDKDPRHAGYMMAKKSDLTKARTAKAIVKRCINKSEDDYPSPYPGTFNFGVHVDSDNRVAESNEKNNWKGERVFTLTENSHLAISQFWLSNPTPQSGETVTAYVKIRNAGTPFGSDKVNTEWRIQGPQYGPDPIILGFDQTKREHLRTNDEAGEDISFVVPTTPGNYTLTVEVDYDFRTTQSDRSGNTASLTITIPGQSEEEGDDPNAQVPCPVITQTNWVSGGWSVRGYSAPFGTDGTILINPSCKKSQPNSLEVTIGNANNPNMVAYMTAYIRDKTTGADMPYPLTCSGLVNNGWCAGTATLTAENSGINTTSNGDPTIFFGYTCELVNGAFQCPPYWQIQGAGLP